jgi:myo-inositol 2-dehydrogenase/D-chiro-inositol 1-dehydrogenase
MPNIGIIGCGRIGKIHIQNIINNVSGSAVEILADPRADDGLRLWAEELGIPRVTADYKEILADPSIDAVLICSPTDTHAAISLEAAAEGKHIFCEKPIAFETANICSVIEAVKRAGVKFQVGFNRRFDSNFRAMRKAVSAGAIGEVHIVRVTSRDPAPPPPEYVLTSGGMFLDMTIHDFDMARYLSGSEAAEVYAMGAVLVDPAIGAAGDIDTAVITMKMANGAIAVIDNSRQAVYGYDQRAEVFGSKGAVSISNNARSTAVISGENGVVSEKPLYFFRERYMQSFCDEITEFVRAINQNTATPVSAEDGLAPVRMALAAMKSMSLNRPVLLDEIE